MEEQKYFREALSDFTFEAAAGGEIRHLADLGLTVGEIERRLDFPVPYEKIRQAVWERLMETGVLLAEEPGAGAARERTAYVREYGKYGKASYRKVSAPAGLRGDAAMPPGEGPASGWAVRDFSKEKQADLAADLLAACRRNGEGSAYLSFAFGLCGEEERAAAIARLDRGQREYVEGLPWPKKAAYHRLDARMRGIAARLYEAGIYHGSCYFAKIAEKWIL